MGQFKPMVKMMTTEPQVELKLKKGGMVCKADGGAMPMQRPPSRPMPMPVSRPPVQRPPKPVSRPPVSRPPVSRPMPVQVSRPMPAPAMKNGGKADMDQDKRMIKKAMKQHDMQEHKGGKGTTLKLKTGGVPKGQGGYKTGGVVDGQGGFKKGGAIKKYAKGGLIDTGRPEQMPQGKKKPSPPVAINELSGTFKKGGAVKC